MPLSLQGNQLLTVNDPTGLTAAHLRALHRSPSLGPFVADMVTNHGIAFSVVATRSLLLPAVC